MATLLLRFGLQLMLCSLLLSCTMEGPDITDDASGRQSKGAMSTTVAEESTAHNKVKNKTAPIVSTLA